MAKINGAEPDLPASAEISAATALLADASVPAHERSGSHVSQMIEPQTTIKQKREAMRRIIVGISGASGVIYGIRLLEALRAIETVETHLVMSPSAGRTILEETDHSIDQVRRMADVVHAHGDIGASISSGSFRTSGMIVAPCSIKSLSGIANSYNDNLLTRAADVCLKERRPLILMVREAPLHLGHLELLARTAQYGATILPPAPAFYNHPATIGDIIDHSVGKALDLLDLPNTLIKRWKDAE